MGPRKNSKTTNGQVCLYWTYMVMLDAYNKHRKIEYSKHWAGLNKSSFEWMKS